MKHLYTKIRKLSDKLKGTYGITVGTDHPQCSEPSHLIIEGVNWNRRQIQNCASIYQRKLWTVSSALIVSKRPFSFIKGSRCSAPIDYLLRNQCEVHLSDEDSDKSYGPQFIWPAFYWSILHCKDIPNHYSSEFIWNFFPLECREWWFDDIVLQFMAHYNSVFVFNSGHRN